MSNNLTGDYDAVLLVRVTKLNGLLATLHQNGADPDKSPTFPHSERTRIGDRPKPLDPPLADYAGWFNELLRTGNGDGDPATRGPKLLDKAPPGAAKVLRKAFEDLQAARLEIITPPHTPLNSRGTAQVQISAPSITLPAGSTSEVTVHVHARAHFVADPGTIALPEPIHGQVSATYTAKTKRLENYGAAKTILEVIPPPDSKIQFDPAPGTGLGPSELNQLTAQIRRVVRENFEPIIVELPADVPFSQFKELGGGQVLALPMSLTSGVEPSAQGINTVTNNFLNSDFAIGISKDYVERFIDIDAIRASVARRRIILKIGHWGVTYDITYRLRFSSGPTLTWRNGAIDISGRIEAETGTWWAPNGFVSFKQAISLELNPITKSVAIKQPLAGPEVDESWFIPHGRAVDTVKTEINKALFEGQPPDFKTVDDRVRNTFADARDGLDKGLRSVDDSASGNYSAVRITPDGVILDGGISTKFRVPPVVHFEETSDGTAFTAFKSWIPGGRIDRFEWSWIMQHPFMAYGGHVESRSDEHRFILPKPTPPPGRFPLVLGSVCLRIHGIQVDGNGFAYPIAAGTVCTVQTPEVSWRMPSWSEPMPTPLWEPTVPLDGILEKHIRGHVNVLAHAQPGGGDTANSVVHFADPGMDQPLEKLRKALARRSDMPLAIIVVLPSGTFGGRRREVEAKLGSLGEEFNGRLVLTEDYSGSWTRTFDAKKMPSTYLMNTRGEFVWKQEGAFDADALAAATEKYLTQRWALRSRPLNLTVQPGHRAPRTLFADDRGQNLALRKFRGHPVLLNFWQSWSAPSIRELQRLQSLQEKKEDAPVVIAVCGDASGAALEEIRRKHKLGFALVHDSNGSMARAFGVTCWPTTLSIDPDGIVNGVQLGVLHDHSPKAPEQSS